MLVENETTSFDIQPMVSVLVPLDYTLVLATTECAMYSGEACNMHLTSQHIISDCYVASLRFAFLGNRILYGGVIYMYQNVITKSISFDAI